ncbi:hypothetical protein AB0469_23105 [Streptomyces sp. NPDC093801]|uniref:hypothetical protein n=1 Tax=Streptomyces sp. NPDC093801 TaxID=3155203 RepID=UPI00344C67D7
MSATPQPTPDEIEDRFAALVEGRLTRDEADRWAAGWVARDELDWDDLSWWALDLLHGIDLPAGRGGGFLHDDEQVRIWLAELRRRRTVA